MTPSLSIERALLPQFFPRSWEDEHDVFGIAFTEDVALGFVTQGDGGCSYLLKSDARANAISYASLLSESLNNLAEMKDGVELKISRQPASTVAWVQTQDNFAAVRMLLPLIKSRLAAEFGDRYLFTIPSRDLCLFWTISSPRELSEKHAQEAQEDYGSEEYNLSPHIYVYTGSWPCQKWK